MVLASHDGQRQQEWPGPAQTQSTPEVEAGMPELQAAQGKGEISDLPLPNSSSLLESREDGS